MSTALRPVAIAGIAVVGAGLMAAAPVVARPPDVRASSADVVLTAINDPTQVFAKALARWNTTFARIVAKETEDPVPILTQIIANQIGAGQVLSTFGEAVQAELDIVAQEWQAAVPEMIDLLNQGKVFHAFQKLSVPVVVAYSNLWYTGALDDFTEILQQPAAAYQAILEDGAIPIGYALFNMMYDPVTFVHTAVYAAMGVRDAIASGDFDSVVNAVQAGIAMTIDTAIITGSDFFYDAPTKIRDYIAGAIKAPYASEDFSWDNLGDVFKVGQPAVAPTQAATMVALDTSVRAKLAPAAAAASTAETPTRAEKEVVTEAATTEDAEPATPVAATNGATDLSDGNLAVPARAGIASQSAGRQIQSAVKDTVSRIRNGIKTSFTSRDAGTGSDKSGASDAGPGKRAGAAHRND